MGERSKTVPDAPIPMRQSTLGRSAGASETRLRAPLLLYEQPETVRALSASRDSQQQETVPCAPDGRESDTITSEEPLIQEAQAVQEIIDHQIADDQSLPVTGGCFYSSGRMPIPSRPLPVLTASDAAIWSS